MPVFHTKAVALNMNIDDVVSEMNTGIAKLTQAADLLNEAIGHVNRAGFNGDWYSTDLFKDLNHVVRYGDPGGKTMESIKKGIYAFVWKAILGKTTLWTILDQEGKDDFVEAISKNPTPPTAATVEATLRKHAANAEDYLIRGLVNVFAGLSRQYSTNSPFKLGKKIVFNGRGFYRGNFSPESRIQDMERLFMILDGKGYTPDTAMSGFSSWYRGLPCAKYRADDFKALPDESKVYEDEYYSAKAFANGNLHITFKRSDLVEQCNRMIGQYFGDVLPNGGKRKSR